MLEAKVKRRNKTERGWRALKIIRVVVTSGSTSPSWITSFALAIIVYVISITVNAICTAVYANVAINGWERVWPQYVSRDESTSVESTCTRIDFAKFFQFKPITISIDEY